MLGENRGSDYFLLWRASMASTASMGGHHMLNSCAHRARCTFSRSKLSTVRLPRNILGKDCLLKQAIGIILDLLCRQFVSPQMRNDSMHFQRQLNFVGNGDRVRRLRVKLLRRVLNQVSRRPDLVWA